MQINRLFLLLLAGAGVVFAQQSAAPHLEKRGAATQLIVDGKPFLMLSGELHNSSSSSLEYMKPIWPQLAEIPDSIAQQIEIDAKYAVYLDRQAADVAAYRRDESVELPEALDYSAMTALSMEVRQKLQSIRPGTIGQAGRIDGMTPAALTLLAAQIRRGGAGKRSMGAS